MWQNGKTFTCHKNESHFCALTASAAAIVCINCYHGKNTQFGVQDWFVVTGRKLRFLAFVSQDDA